MKLKTFVQSLMGFLGSAAALSAILGSAHASESLQDLYPYLAGRMYSAGTLQNLNLTLNHRLIVERDGVQRRMEPQGDTLREVETRTFRRETTATDAIGRVVDMEAHPEPDSDCSGSIILFVSFNRTCTTRDCAYGFASKSNMGNFFRLAYIPTSGHDEQIDVYVRRSRARFRIPQANQPGWCLSDSSHFVELENTDGNRLELKLQYPRDSVEMDDVSVNNIGWEEHTPQIATIAN